MHVLFSNNGTSGRQAQPWQARLRVTLSSDPEYLTGNIKKPVRSQLVVGAADNYVAVLRNAGKSTALRPRGDPGKCVPTRQKAAAQRPRSTQRRKFPNVACAYPLSVTFPVTTETVCDSSLTRHAPGCHTWQGAEYPAGTQGGNPLSTQHRVTESHSGQLPL